MYGNDPGREQFKARLDAEFPHGRARVLVRGLETTDFEALLERYRATIYDMERLSAFRGFGVIVSCADFETARAFEAEWELYAKTSPHRQDVRAALALIQADRTRAAR